MKGERQFGNNVYRDESNLFSGKGLRGDGVSMYLMTDLTEKQRKLFKLLHPNEGGLTLIEAAETLGISIQAVHKMYDLMKKQHPDAFAYEIFEERQIGGASDIQHVYIGYKKFANIKGREFTLTIEDVEEILQLPCYGSECEPILPTVNTKTGNKFRRHHLSRFDTSSGYTYVNSKSICSKCGRIWKMV